MKIVYIVPGSGQSFYCENCFRDFSMISGLRTLGHEVTVVPMYLPLNYEEGADLSVGPLFFGAVRLYLEEKYRILKRLPDPLLKMFNSPSMLRMAAARAGSTRALGNEKLTLTMLEGEHGSQAKEFERLARWVVHEVHPEAVIVSNMLLLGVGESIHTRIPIPVFCFAQDEDTWVNSSSPMYRDALWDTIARHDQHVTHYFSLSQWYIDQIIPFIKLQVDRFSVIPFGVNPDNYSMTDHDNRKPVIGFLSRFNRASGLYTLINAFHICTQKINDITPHLSLCGGLTGDDRPELNKHLALTQRYGTVSIAAKFGITERAAFLSSLSVLSVPCLQGIAFGTFIIEGLAAGVPVVQPAIGGFPEIGALSDSVILYSPNTVEVLADTLEHSIRDQQKRKTLGKRGFELVREQLSHTHMAKAAITIMEKCVS